MTRPSLLLQLSIIAHALSLGHSGFLSKYVVSSLPENKVGPKHTNDAVGEVTCSLHPSSQPYIDVSSIEEHRDFLDRWLRSLSGVERSKPTWVAGEEVDMLKNLSPSQLVQDHLDSIRVSKQCIDIFPSKSQQAKFDWEWRYALMKLFHEEVEDPTELPWLSQGTSNGHPLRVQLVAIPPSTVLALHVHAGIELDIPIFGTLYERKPVNADVVAIDRKVVFAPRIGTGGDVKRNPSPEELKLMALGLSFDMVLNDSGKEGAFVEAPKIGPGATLVNTAGSIHQSFTKDEPCLLWVLGTNIHVCFQPGNFLQRTGIGCLENIDHLLD